MGEQQEKRQAPARIVEGEGYWVDLIAGTPGTHTLLTFLGLERATAMLSNHFALRDEQWTAFMLHWLRANPQARRAALDELVGPHTTEAQALALKEKRALPVPIEHSPPNDIDPDHAIWVGDHYSSGETYEEAYQRMSARWWTPQQGKEQTP